MLKVKVEKLGENDKKITENYLVSSTDRFSDGESLAFQIDDVTDVVAMKRINIMEIFCENELDPECEFFMVEVRDVFVNDNGKEKILKYNVICQAKNSGEAYKTVKAKLEEGYDGMYVGDVREFDIVSIVS